MDEKEQMNFMSEQLQVINKKLDKLTELTEQTHLQEYRLTKLEEELMEMRKNKKDVFVRVFTPVLSSIVSAIIAFIVAGGLKIQ